MINDLQTEEYEDRRTVGRLRLQGFVISCTRMYHLATLACLSNGDVCRLGFWKEPRGLHWVPVPPASCHARVHGVLAAAASSGAACLHLAAMLPVRVLT